MTSLQACRILASGLYEIEALGPGRLPSTRSRLSFSPERSYPEKQEGGPLSTDHEQPTAHEARTSVLLEVSNTMVTLYKRQFGRGPTGARTVWSGPDALTCFLEDTLTPAERNLVAMGEHKVLRDTRMVFQYATVREFCEPVEKITGRTIRAFHSSIDTEADGMGLETFVFYPEGQEGESRIERAEP